MNKWIKQLFCLHLNYQRDYRKLFSAWHNSNYYICINCKKSKNFGFQTYGQSRIAIPNLPINFDLNINSEDYFEGNLYE